jgi:hypothetical protein
LAWTDRFALQRLRHLNLMGRDENAAPHHTTFCGAFADNDGIGFLG